LKDDRSYNDDDDNQDTNRGRSFTTKEEEKNTSGSGCKEMEGESNNGGMITQEHRQDKGD
jgi:hypothetical protein